MVRRARLVEKPAASSCIVAGCDTQPSWHWQHISSSWVWQQRALVQYCREDAIVLSRAEGHVHLKGPSGVLRSLVISSNFLPFFATNRASLSATDWASLEAGEAAGVALGPSGQGSSWTRVSRTPRGCAVSKQGASAAPGV